MPLTQTYFETSSSQSDTAADVVLAVAGQLGRDAWPNVMPVSTSTGSPFTT